MIPPAIAVEENPLRSHPPQVAHHFESAQQQYDAGKLGMWLFLVTEVLFFSGLFVAYAVYRVNHPEVFVDAHKYLNTTLGSINTIVLLLSSLTMAWSVRCAQLGQRRTLVILLAATLCCASFFLGIKAVEYGHKWAEGLLWAGAYSAESRHDGSNAMRILSALLVLSVPAFLVLLCSAIGVAVKYRQTAARKTWFSFLLVAISYFVGIGVGQAVEVVSASSDVLDIARVDDHIARPNVEESSIQLTGVFFSIYYVMTGVHAIHIVAGMGVIAWLLSRSVHGDFGPQNFAPVDYVGLYWHVVDLVWIYLFPLLYLIR